MTLPRKTFNSKAKSSARNYKDDFKLFYDEKFVENLQARPRFQLVALSSTLGQDRQEHANP